MDNEKTTNIDDLLLGSQGNSQQPATPEVIDEQQAEKVSENMDASESDYGIDEIKQQSLDIDEDEPEEHVQENKSSPSIDEYGNETENMTDGMKKRLKKQADKYESRIQELENRISQLTPLQQQQLQQAAQSFEPDNSSSESWETQLNNYIDQRVQTIQAREQQSRAQIEEQRIQKEFERKLFTGLERFDDFRETISGVGCEITDHMTNATRSLDDPAAFLYAAAKRHPEELQRISKLRDPYAQVREMGKLEAKMRKGKATTNTPKPLGRAQEDASMPNPKSKNENDDNFDNILAKNDAKRLAQVRARIR